MVALNANLIWFIKSPIHQKKKQEKNGQFSLLVAPSCQFDLALDLALLVARSTRQIKKRTAISLLFFLVAVLKIVALDAKFCP